MKGFGNTKNSKNNHKKNIVDKTTLAKLISKALKTHYEGNITEAIKYYQ